MTFLINDYSFFTWVKKKKKDVAAFSVFFIDQILRWKFDSESYYLPGAKYKNAILIKSSDHIRTLSIKRFVPAELGHEVLNSAVVIISKYLVRDPRRVTDTPSALRNPSPGDSSYS